MPDVHTHKMIVVKTQFVAFHRYKDAPEVVRFLREWHRHVFHVELYLDVDVSRQLEFFMVKETLNEFLKANYEDRFFEFSCEEIAEDILFYFHQAREARVYEDNENGAVVRKCS
jgi:hypothetical protein